MRVLAKSSNIIVVPENREKKIGLIIVPHTVAERKYKWGKVESIGDLEGDEITVGDQVVYRMDGVNKVNEDKEDEVHIVPYASLLFWR